MKRIAIGLLALALAAGVAMAGDRLNPGEKAPAFTAKTASGDSVALADYAGKVVLVDVWASWCGPCMIELPELDKLAARLAGKDAVVLAVNIDDTQDNAERFITRAKIAHATLLFDAEKAVPAALSIDAMPTSIVIDKDGVIRHVNRGYGSGDVETMEAVIESLLK